jgi:hypothetical protein
MNRDGSGADSSWELTDSSWELTDSSWELTDSVWELTDSGWDLTDSGWDLTDSDWELADSVWELTDSGWDLADSGWDFPRGGRRDELLPGVSNYPRPSQGRADSEFDPQGPHHHGCGEGAPSDTRGRVCSPEPSARNIRIPISDSRTIGESNRPTPKTLTPNPRASTTA